MAEMAVSKKGLFAARAKRVPQFIPRNRTVRQHATHCQVPPDVWVGCCLSRRAAPDPQRPFEPPRALWQLANWNGHSSTHLGWQVVGHCRRSGDEVGEAVPRRFSAVRTSLVV